MTAWFTLPGGIRLGTLVTGIIICTATWFLLLLIHGYRHPKNGFDMSDWFKQRSSTLIVGMTITLILALIRAFATDTTVILKLFGIESNQPGVPILLGLAIAGILLGMGPKRKIEEEQKQQ